MGNSNKLSSKNLLSTLLIVCVVLLGCAKAPDIQGEWFFDYEQTQLTEFPNSYYESARTLIADIEPRYGAINIEGNTVVLGGAVCKILRINDKRGLSCTERNHTNLNGFYYEDDRLIVHPQDRPDVRLVFSRNRQDPEKVYDLDLKKSPVEENVSSAELLLVPSTNKNGLIGIARTTTFDAFYDQNSLSNEGRNVSVAMILNYFEPQRQSESATASLSSVQFVTFDCPASNYRLNRYVMFGESNGTGAVISDSGATDPASDWKPVPENSINKALYMRVCR